MTGGDGVGTPEGQMPKGKTSKGKMLENACFRLRRAHNGQVAASRTVYLALFFHFQASLSNYFSTFDFECQ